MSPTHRAAIFAELSPETETADKALSRNNRSIFEQNPLTPAPLSPKGARGEWIRNYNPLSLGLPWGRGWRAGAG